MCGILSYYSNNPQSLIDFKNVLIKLQHRGQDSCGISYIQDGIHKIVNEKTFGELATKIKNIESRSIVGHVRYTTSGSKTEPVYQPYYSSNKYGKYSLVFNGNIPIDHYYENSKYTSDTIMIIDFLNEQSHQKMNWIELIKYFIEFFNKSYSLIIQTEDSMFILRDSYGVRPLYYTASISEEDSLLSEEDSLLSEEDSLLSKEDSLLSEEDSLLSEEDSLYKTYKFSSESYVFDSRENPQEIKAGTIHVLNKSEFKCIYDYGRYYQSHCLFEYIYFLNKNSHFENTKVSDYRNKVGAILADQDIEFKNSLDKYIVVGVPNTGNDYALSYSKSSGIQYENYITKNKGVNRTFILKTNEELNKYANLKYIFNENIKNKNIILIDDSLVRGITLNNIIRNLKEFGVNEIHIRIASPPIEDTCIYGIDIPTKEELIFNSYNNKQDLVSFFKCDTIKYLNINKLKDVLTDFDKKCTLCLNKDPTLEW